MYFILFAIFEYILDQASKYFILKNFYIGKSVAVIKPVLYFTYIQNKGAAFGLFTNLSLILMSVSVFVLVLFVIFSGKIIKLPASFQIPLGFIFGATAGNLTDRLRFGSVVDFIDFRVWPIFNFADCALTICLTWLAVLIIIKESSPR